MMVVLLASLADCAAPPSSAPPTTAAPVAQVDGEYRGTDTRYQADSRGCPHPGLVTVIVFNDQFQYRWDHDTWLDALIDPDGSVHAQGPGITLQGRAAGRVIEGDVTNGTCGYHFKVTKRPS
jgi:hypothetical protein